MFYKVIGTHPEELTVHIFRGRMPSVISNDFLRIVHDLHRTITKRPNTDSTEGARLALRLEALMKEHAPSVHIPFVQGSDLLAENVSINGLPCRKGTQLVLRELRDVYEKYMFFSTILKNKQYLAAATIDRDISRCGDLELPLPAGTSLLLTPIGIPWFIRTPYPVELPTMTGTTVTGTLFRTELDHTGAYVLSCHDGLCEQTLSHKEKIPIPAEDPHSFFLTHDLRTGYAGIKKKKIMFANGTEVTISRSRISGTLARQYTFRHNRIDLTLPMNSFFSAQLSENGDIAHIISFETILLQDLAMGLLDLNEKHFSFAYGTKVSGDEQFITGTLAHRKKFEWKGREVQLDAGTVITMDTRRGTGVLHSFQ